MHPCGTACEMLRSCYKTQANLGDGIIAEIQWFFVDDDAEDFPGQHFMGSRNWLADGEAYGPLGEIEGATRTWTNGSYPCKPIGRGPDGPLEDFLTGSNAEDHGALELNSVGIPKGCAPNRGAFSGSFSGDYDSINP